MEYRAENFVVKIPSDIQFGCGTTSLLAEKLSPYKKILS